jgi:flagellar biosynthesis chaperone FliJ
MANCLYQRDTSIGSTPSEAMFPMQDWRKKGLTARKIAPASQFLTQFGLIIDQQQHPVKEIH